MKSLVIKSQAGDSLDIADRNREIIKKYKMFHLSYFIGKNYFVYDRSQNFLMLQPIYDTFTKQTGHTERIISWKLRFAR